MDGNYITAVDAVATWRDSVLSGEKPPRWSVGEGFENVNLAPGQVMLLGGAPGTGKTALAMQWMVDAMLIDETLRVLVCNVETSPAVLLDRQLARLSGILLDLIHDRRLGKEHAERLHDAFDDIESIADRLTFLTAPFNLENVAATADATESKLIVIDYAQRFTTGETEKRHDVSKLMDYLRQFASEGNGFLVLAAVGRTKDSRGRSSYDPSGLNLASFRESSELEFGADSAFMLLPQKSGGVKLACLKNRHGEPVSIELSWDGSSQRFTPPPSLVAMQPWEPELWNSSREGESDE